MKKIEKYIIAVITLIAIGAIGTAVYFGVNKTGEVSNKGNNVEINTNNQESLGDQEDSYIDNAEVYSDYIYDSKKI